MNRDHLAGNLLQSLMYTAHFDCILDMRLLQTRARRPARTATRTWCAATCRARAAPPSPPSTSRSTPPPPTTCSVGRHAHGCKGGNEILRLVISTTAGSGQNEPPQNCGRIGGTSKAPCSLQVQVHVPGSFVDSFVASPSWGRRKMLRALAHCAALNMDTQSATISSVRVMILNISLNICTRLLSRHPRNAQFKSYK